MKVRQRILYLQKLDGEDRAPLFGMVCNDLQTSLRAWMDGDPGSVVVNGWPSIEWQDENRRLGISAWASEDGPDHRLLSVELAQRVGLHHWTVSIQIGSLRAEEIVIEEICRLEPYTAQPPIEDIPDVLDFLSGYRCIDEDRLFAGRVYDVTKPRAAPFAEFVRAGPSERRLPVVVISPVNGVGGNYLLAPKDLAKMLRGLAHVMTLNKRSRWYSSDLPLTHPCFNGAVRVYLPDYAEDDPPGMHKYWRPDLLSAAEGKDVSAELSQFIFEKMWSQDYENSVLASLRQERIEEATQSQVRQHVETVRQRIRSEVEAQSKASEDQLFADFSADYERLAQEYDRVTEENGRLLRQIKAQEDEIRGLRYRLKQQWVAGEGLPDEEKPAIRVFLSQQAHSVYSHLDAGEREEVASALLGKLLNPELRQGQTEPISSMDETCYVYPRSRSAGGRRVIYLMDDSQIKVCEIFMNHDAYEAMRNRLRGRGIDLSEYSEFTAWQPDEVDLLRKSALGYLEEELAESDGF